MNLLLDTTTRTLTGQLSATPSTGVSVLVSYADKTASSLTYGLSATSLTNTTETTICAAPAASTQRLAKDADVRVSNPGTVSVDFTLRIDDNGTKYIVNTVTVAAGESVDLSFDTSATELTVNSTVLVYNDLPIGAVAPLVTTSVPDGWLLANGATIGNASSGSSARANSDTYTLFCLLYNEWSDTTSPVLTSAGAGTTRAAQGTSATAFAAAVRVTLPDLTGRVVAGKEASETRLTAAVCGFSGATLGVAGGSQLLHQHNHPPKAGTYFLNYDADGSVGPVAAGGNEANQTSQTTTGNAGTGSSQNVQPTIVLPYIVKFKNSGVAVPVTTLGVVDASNAAAGVVGEYVSAAKTTSTNLTNQTVGGWWDAADLVLTLQPGDWDVTCLINLQRNTSSGFSTIGSIVTTTGTSSDPADQIVGTNVLYTDSAGATFGNLALMVPNYRINISTATTYRVKIYMASTSGTPKYYGRLSARRMR
jgi:hypothetical protein